MKLVIRDIGMLLLLRGTMMLFVPLLKVSYCIHYKDVFVMY